MWRQVGAPRVLPLTRELAEDFATMPSADVDRPLAARRLAEHRRNLEAGRMRSVEWSSCRCRADGRVYRVNGKHTSHLLATADELPDIHVVMTEYEADTPADVADLYATFDSRTQMRTGGDVNHAYAATHPVLASIPGRTLNIIVSGIAYAEHLDQYSHAPLERRAARVLDEVEFASWYDRIVSEPGAGGDRADHIRRVPVAAAMFLTHRKDADAATAFWSAVRDETGPRPDLPDRVLARWLSQNTVNTGNGARASARRASPREFFCRCLHGWNAWRRGRTTVLRYFPDAEPPAVA